ncbi:hypothetical protein M4D73_33765 [Streptomyces pseudogriseolus]|uniref:hypothetical protein n=1 Tax=Streptomyces pseudogriseolus TaxID=36817 RepID=UPI003488DB81|nr:hypothetical protein [Streptomyces pseudogriseolus]
MSVTMEDVLAALEPEEPDYAKIEQLGPDCFPHLHAIFRGNDPLLASKAAYAASLLPNVEAHDLVIAAAQSDSASLRAAATGGASNLPAPAAAVALVDLLADRETSVRNKAEAIVAADAADHADGGGPTLADLIKAIQRDRERHGGAGVADIDADKPGSLRSGFRQPGLMPGEEGTGSANGSRPTSLSDRAKPGPGSANEAVSPGSGLMPGETSSER